MDSWGCADDAFIFFESSAMGEVEVSAEDVGDECAGFAGDTCAGGVVPDAFYIWFFGWETEVGVCLASGDDGVFALGVEACGFSGVA